MSTIAERVAAGAAFLDEREPGWWQRIDLARLDLGDCEDCVLGQLAGGYEDGLARVGLVDDAAVEGGFAEEDIFVSQGDYPALTAEWRKVITGRRAAS